MSFYLNLALSLTMIVFVKEKTDVDIKGICTVLFIIDSYICLKFL